MILCSFSRITCRKTMIDKLKLTAQTIYILRIPSIIIGLTCLISVSYIFLTSRSHEDDFFLIPSFIGLLWAVSTHYFIVTFCSAPEFPNQKIGFFKKLKYKLKRAWYWTISIFFLVTSVLLVLMTFRILSYWIRSY